MLKKGVYEHIINQETKRHIKEAEQEQLVCSRQEVDAAESPQLLAHYLAETIRQKLEETEQQIGRAHV